ncbi:hypothetical protein [Polycladidibacter stylochi]|uniref:hypothetical protein n=1 Tax=Polycladidibacter stylochi TaxID=1807766 RepID=UPI00082D158B|nr:hypothetical protein [Pseudovibrio stylochi]
MLSNSLVLITALIVFIALISNRLRNNQRWQATLTPLASIIGSGFLVSVPILAFEIGNWAIIGIIILITGAYFIGSVIRFNIRYAEPLFSQPDTFKKHSLTLSLEKISQLLLAFAYFISIAYYLVLLGNFLLKGMGFENTLYAKIIASALLIAIGTAGICGGLSSVERVEKYAVAFNLAIIAGLLVGLMFYNGEHLTNGTWHLANIKTPISLHKIQVLLGLLIIVQGFETSRFLGDEYGAPTRISSMRQAQLLSAVIYIVFFASITILFGFLQEDRSIAAVISLVGHVALVLPLMLTLGAVASQFGAAIADSLGSAGLLEDTSERYISVNHAYLIITVVALAILWNTDVTQIVTLASQAFALFYLTQCGVALAITCIEKEIPNRARKALGFSLVALLCLSVILFGLPSNV